ncbi:hypothetical protein AX15_002250 [Amanita polypyramis BW_CC]|nr:hypothetical protein AX15_002250 [Amanita polypyramis BW_CC]
MTTANQPRARPKPKPKVKTATPADPGPSTEWAPESTQTTPQPVLVRDEDEFFMRNRKRTTATWQKLKEIDKKAKVEATGQESEDEQHTPRKNKRKRPNEHDLPRWQRDEKFVRMLSEQLSDKSDDDILEVTDVTKPSGRLATRKERSRSRSLTPPPVAPFQEIQKARNLVRQTLETVPRPSSPDLLDADDSTDTLVLNSELASLAQTLVLPMNTKHTSPQASERDTIQIKVEWKSHPKDVNGVERVSAYRMNRSESFRDLFNAAADDFDVLVQNLVMTYNGKRLFSSASPRGLDIWVEADFVACDKATYAYIQANNFVRESSVLTIDHRPQSRTHTGGAETIELISDDEDDDPTQTYSYSTQPPPQSQTLSQPQPQGHIHESDAESEAESDKFKIVLQSSLTQGKNITLTVRPTTKCGSIVKAFLKKAGLADQYSHVFDDTIQISSTQKRARKPKVPQKDPRICIDGEKMSNDTEIGDADLEDGDMIEVVGL